MPTFNLNMTRTETHTISVALDAETLEDATALMYDNELERWFMPCGYGCYDGESGQYHIHAWVYEFGQVDDVSLAAATQLELGNATATENK
jgi:hypothetical protein